MSINYSNFLIYPKDLSKESLYDFSPITYGIDIKDKIKNEFGTIVLFECPEYDNFYEILTKGDGSCFYYATETINSIKHIERKQCYLANSIFSIEKEKTKEELIELLKNRSKEEFIQLLSKENNKEKCELCFKEYEYNHIGLGIEFFEAVKELEEMKIPTIIFVLPIPKNQRKKICEEFCITEEELRNNDYEKYDTKIGVKENTKDEDIMYILFRRGHFSRLIPKSQFPSLQSFIHNNKASIEIIQIIE